MKKPLQQEQLKCTCGHYEHDNGRCCGLKPCSTVKKMLNNMFIGSPKGNYDRLLDFSTPKTGTLFFVPTLDMLDDFSSG